MITGSDQYKAAYQAALQELVDLIRESERLETEHGRLSERIEALRAGAPGLALLAGEPDPTESHPDIFPSVLDPDVGITDAVREVLKTAPPAIRLSAVSVKNKLEQMGFDIGKYKNVLAVIHQVLRRLHEGGEAKMVTNSEGKAMYIWKADSGKRKKQSLFDLVKEERRNRPYKPVEMVDEKGRPKNVIK
jgi:hypothetical protein